MTKKMIEDRNQYKKGLWTAEEDRMLIDYVRIHGKGHWNRVANKTGLKRSGKSCRLRWMNYLSPNVKRDRFSEQEEDLIIRLQNLLGNRWSLIAKRVPGRTDNQVKNYWNTHLSKKLTIHHERSTGIDVSSPTKSREIAASKTVANSDNSTLSGNANSRNNFLVDVEMQKASDQEALVTEEPVMKDDDMNPLWIIDDAMEMSDLMMELGWCSFDLAWYN